ncbi:glycosyltransferase family 4 protein [Hyphomicrobium sp.]|uniref:glycosyltransferase family 4 protein n=1 Tax=Hyphomicrobium sp. TaxID=82 RepID=UPI002BD6D918|nr:glycosyltransferase family 4 protein [Hyphomicrobium sp.]HVZ03769.1 glycosyltransferase family 4 protein [Hyphomicrobium sp.]
MAEAVFAIPGDLKSATGGYAYDRRVIESLPDFGVSVSVLPLPDAFPNPTPADLAETHHLIESKPRDAVLLADGLAFGAFNEDLLNALQGRVIALVHHPLFLETGLPHARKVELKATEERALCRANHIVVTSRVTKRILVDNMGISTEKITVAEPGTDPAQRATGTGAPLQILSVGTVLPRKGYHLLVEALAPLKHLDWRLTIAGALDRHAEAVATLREAVRANGLDDRVTLAGKVVPATLERYYESADLFVSASLFEGYGMVLAEAMARGLPMVIAAGGAAAETAGDAAALHVEAGNVLALTTALERALTDKKLRDRLADAAWEAGRTLPTWHETARRIAAVILGLRS